MDTPPGGCDQIDPVMNQEGAAPARGLAGARASPRAVPRAVAV